MKLKKESNQLNLTVVALVALVAIVGLVALVLNAASLATVSEHLPAPTVDTGLEPIPVHADEAEPDGSTLGLATVTFVGK